MKANRKIIAIIIATLVLVAAATTGVVMYLNDDGTSRAGFDENEPSISDVNTNPGSTEENNQGENAGNTENPVNNNEPGNLPEAGENANQGTTANRGGTTGANTNQGTTTTTGNANVPNQEYVTERVEEVERQITEDLLVGWTPLSITSAYSTNGIGIYKPDLEIVKVASTTDGNNSVAVGDALTYAMAVKNNGNEDITGLTISDVIPEQTTFIEGTIYGNGTYNKELNKIVWKVDVKAGEVVAVGFAVTVNENATGAIKNVGTIDGKNTEEVVNPVITSEKLAEVYRDKQPIEGPANIGDQIKYTIVAKNTGDVDATVVMKDTIPANTELVSPIEVAGEEIDEATMNVGKNVTVPAGETVELTFTVEIKAVEGSIKNIATVGTTIPDTETKTANLEMTKKVSDKINGEYSKNVTLKVGETAYFKIELNNTGSEDLEVKMTDIMNDTDIQLYDGDKAIAQTVTVPAGTTKTLTATYTMQQEDIDNQQLLKNTATATTPVTPGNEDTAEVTPEKAEPGIKVEKTTVSVTSNGITTDVVNGKAPMVRAGDVITYTITVTNTGNTTLKDIKVIDTTLDVNYDNTTIKAGTSIDTISSLAPKNYKTYTVTYTVTPDDIENKTQIENFATATGSEEVPSTPVLVNPNVTVSGEKTWNDYNEQEQKRPVSITVKVMNGDKEVETIEVKPDANGNWKYTSKALPKYDENNNVIKYAVIEEAVEGYTPSYAEVKGIGTANITANITNTLSKVPTVTVSGEKTWKDYNEQEQKRPESITVKVMNGDKVEQTIEVKPDANGNWKYTSKALPKYDENNNVIKYAVIEEAVEGYTPSYAEVKGIGTANITANITNTLSKVPTVTVSGEKTWKDYNEQEQKRPESITVKVMNGDKVEQTIEVKPDANGNWKYTSKALPKYDANNNVIEYTVVEEKLDNYNVEYNITVDEKNGNITANITNTLNKVPTVTVSGKKTWHDYNGQEGTRPESITVKVMNGDKEVETIEVKPNEDGNWEYTSESLPKYDENNNIIEYTVVEEKLDDYNVEYNRTVDEKTGDITANITNTLNRVPTVTVSGTKHWEDEEDQDGIRPDNITIAVISSDKTDKTERLQTIGKKDDVTYNWTYRFTGLPKYDANNQEIQYSVTETGIDEKYYTSTPATVRKENGNFIADITNKHTPATISLIATKHWEDASNQDGFRPTTIKIKVMEVTDEQNIKVKEETFTGTGNDWTYEFKELPKYKNGNQINYTIVEEITTNKYKASNPTITVDPTTGNITAEITNTHIPETVNISGTKTWVNDNETQRPDSITVNLLEDGTTVNSTEVTENKDGKWVYEFKDLPKYKNGTEIKYTVKEDAVARYETTYSGYDIINTLKPLDLTTKKITSTKGEKVAPGEEITYTISIKNNSNEATGTFNVKDSVPAGTTLKTEENPAYTSSVENNVTWLTWNVSLEANASTTVSFTVIVDMTLNDGDKIKNKAIVDEKDTNEVIDTVKNIVRTVNVKEHGNSISKTNIVIVLDLSSSMTENKSNRLANAKTAAKEFIDSIYTSKAVSGVNIEVITFNTRDAIEKKNVESEECTRSKNPDHYDRGFFGYYHKDSGTSCEQHGDRWYTKYVEKTETVLYSGTKVLEIEGITGNVAKNYDDAQKIKSAIEAIEIPADYKEGGFGTHMYAALQLANTEISKLKDAYKNNDNAVVFLGDGKPFRSKDYPEYADNTDKNIKLEASTIRTKATLYAIRYAEDVALLKDINNGGIASKGCSFASTDLSGLKSNFQAIKDKAQDREIPMNSDNGYLVIINPTGLVVSDKKPVTIRKNGTVIATYTSLEDLNNSGLITYDATTKEIKWNVRGYAKTDKLEIEYYVN